MYAIVSIAGQQFKVEKNKRIFVHRLPGEAGTTSEFDKVLLIDNEGRINIGNPYIDNALVTARIISHLKGDKVLVFKKKRKKGYRKLNGHRQLLTEIIIDEILVNVTAKKTKPAMKKEKKEEPEKPQPVVVATTVSEKKPVKAKPQKAKKPAVKKAEKDEPKKAGLKAEKVVKKTTTSDTKAKSGTGRTKKAEPKASSAKKQTKGKK